MQYKIDPGALKLYYKLKAGETFHASSIYSRGELDMLNWLWDTVIRGESAKFRYCECCSERWKDMRLKSHVRYAKGLGA